MSNSLDPDQDRQNVGPDLGPTCLQRLSTDDKSHRLTYMVSRTIFWSGLLHYLVLISQNLITIINVITDYVGKRNDKAQYLLVHVIRLPLLYVEAALMYVDLANE